VGGVGQCLCISDAGNKELVGDSHESRRVEDTTERDQDCISVVFPIMIMVLMMHQ
jgi:hypothetical protein